MNSNNALSEGRTKAVRESLAYDGLTSAIGGMGNPRRDKAAALSIERNCISDEQLVVAYESNWIAQNLIEIPVEDATRKWRIWTGAGADNMRELERRLELRKKTFEAFAMGRLFGAAALYIVTDQPPETPLNIEAIGRDGIRNLAVFTRPELSAAQVVRDPSSEWYNQPEYYTVNTTSQIIAKIHPSRLAIFTGPIRPHQWRHSRYSRRHTSGSDWGGNSTLQSVYDTVTQTSGVFQGIASLALEANVDVIQIPELMVKIGDPTYEADLIKRMQIAVANKGINGTLLMDAEEKYERKNASFANLNEIVLNYAMFCGASEGIPATRFISRTPNGIGNSAKEELDNYYDKVSSLQVIKLDPALYRITECMRQAIGAGSDLVYDWCPLAELSEEEQAETDKKRTESLKNMVDANVPLEAQYAKQKRYGYFEGTSIDSFEKFKESLNEMNPSSNEEVM